MKIINSIKTKIGIYFLKKETLKHRKHKEIISFNEAKHIGIIYKVVDEDFHNSVIEFIKTLQDIDIDVHALGFVDYKDIPHYCYPKIKHKVLTLKHLNWHYKPMGIDVNDFSNKEFDILIDLTMNNYIPVQYVLSHSQAKYIVGKYYETSTHYYDMMLKVDNSFKINEFIKVVVEYLKIIKPHKKCIPITKQLELL